MNPVTKRIVFEKFLRKIQKKKKILRNLAKDFLKKVILFVNIEDLHEKEKFGKNGVIFWRTFRFEQMDRKKRTKWTKKKKEKLGFSRASKKKKTKKNFSFFERTKRMTRNFLHEDEELSFRFCMSQIFEVDH
jgi:hypothetical protein